MTSNENPLWAARPVEWAISEALVPYPAAVAFMERRIEAILAGETPEMVWLLEHPPLYTAGTSARPEDLREAERFPVFPSARGGQYTYHGPGQLVAYVMLDLNRRKRDVRQYVQALEHWIIGALAEFNIKGEIREGRVGVWVEREAQSASREDKIAAIGVRLRKWVTYHGISLNVEPDLSHFSGIVPCGIDQAGLGVTSLVDLGLPVGLSEAEQALRQSFEEIFGPVTIAPAPELVIKSTPD